MTSRALCAGNRVCAVTPEIGRKQNSAANDARRRFTWGAFYRKCEAGKEAIADDGYRTANGSERVKGATFATVR